jgi:hypothetical protein
MSNIAKLEPVGSHACARGYMDGDAPGGANRILGADKSAAVELRDYVGVVARFSSRRLFTDLPSRAWENEFVIGGTPAAILNSARS